MRVFLGFLTVAILLGALLSLTSAAGDDEILSFQGRITDKDGFPLTGNYSITFRVYDAETGGSQVWTETHGSVELTNGIFSVLLGETNALILGSAEGYWVSIEVGSDGEMSPRLRLARGNLVGAKGDPGVAGAMGDAGTAGPKGDKGDPGLLQYGGSVSGSGGSWAARFVSTSAGTAGVRADSTSYIGVYGTSVRSYGVYGSSTSSTGIYGTSSSSYGIRGVSTSNYGVYGTSTTNAAVRGSSTSSYGLYGSSTNSYGVYGTSASSFGVRGFSNSSTGVYGNSTLGYGVFGTSTSNVGVYGSSTSNYGVRGQSTTSRGVYGSSTSSQGVFGSSTSAQGVYGSSTSNHGIFGTTNRSGSGYAGVYGTATSAVGVNGVSTTSYGVVGTSTGNYGVFGSSVSSYGARGSSTLSYGVYGNSTSSHGVYGTSSRNSSSFAAVAGVSSSAKGVYGESATRYAVHGKGTGQIGVYAQSTSNAGVWGDASTTSDYGGYFRNLNGSTSNGVFVGGKIVKTGTVSFVVRHPENKRKAIVYVCLEGGEAGTYCRGTAQLENGMARIDLPKHFRLVSGSVGLTAQVTPRGMCEGIAALEVTKDYVVVRELSGGTSNATFDWIVHGHRKGYENYDPVTDEPGLMNALDHAEDPTLKAGERRGSRRNR